MCGILGIWNLEDVVESLLSGLTAIQHRGQDSAGILTYDETKRMFNIKKGLGLVKEVFDEKNIARLVGKHGLGHVRYSTTGSGEEKDAQPLYGTQFYEIAIIHNGNVTSKHNEIIRDTGCDVEIILRVLSEGLLEQQNGKPDQTKLAPEQIFRSIERVFEKVQGSYSVVGMISSKYFFAFRDPLGIKPIIRGCINKGGKKSHVFASESNVLDSLGAEVIKDLEPGEAIIIDSNNNEVSYKTKIQKTHKPCIFEYIYFAHPSSVIDSESVSQFREKLGCTLADEIIKQGITADYVIPVPSSSYNSALALSQKTGIPYALGLTRNNYVGRSFIEKSSKKRRSAINEKLFVDKRYVSGKNIIIVDDSIVRGTTSEKVVSLLRKANVNEITFVSASPPIKYPCVYGIDMSIDKELIASEKNVEEIRKYVGADRLIYLPNVKLKEIFRNSMCDACFSGDYPTNITKEEIEMIKQGRIRA